VDLQTRVFELPNSEAFEKYYDKIQSDLQIMSGMDELLAGMRMELGGCLN
jgi:hypothetical protein